MAAKAAWALAMRSFWRGILCHTHDHDRMCRDGGLDFFHDIELMIRDFFADGGMDMVFGQDGAGHDKYLFGLM